MCVHQTTRSPTEAERDRSCSLGPCTDEKEGGKSWIRGEITWWEAEREGEGGQHADREGRKEREREPRADRRTRRGALWRSLLWAGACSGPLQATAQNRAPFFSLPLLLPFASSTVRERREVSRRKVHCWTESSERQLSRDEPRRVFEKAPLLSEGGMAMEYGLPFQEGRTRWRGARTDGWMVGWIYSSHRGCCILCFSCPLLHHLFFLCYWIVSLVSLADFYQPPTSFALPPFLLRSPALSQMVNLNGLLVKSTSTDGFHLETGLLDPPLQFPPPPPPPHPLLCLPLFFPTQVLKAGEQVSGCDCEMFRGSCLGLL